MLFVEQSLEKIQKDLAVHKTDLEECRGKLELSEKNNTEISSNLGELKSDIHKLQESVKW